MSTGSKILLYVSNIVVIGLIVWLFASAKENTETAAPVSGDHLSAQVLMEVKTPKGLREQIIPYTGMTVSFNRDTHQPNYVAWELLGAETDGATGRQSQFAVDPEIPGCATPDDYKHTGFDRGHMAPAGDMKWHPQAMRESFYMTNISPQAGELNRGAWKTLEEMCRRRAQADSALIIICGPIFDKGERAARIGASGVAVPQRFFKVILSPYVAQPYATAYIMDNGYVKGGVDRTVTTVDEVEALTGYDFFSALPDSLETRLEAASDHRRFATGR